MTRAALRCAAASALWLASACAVLGIEVPCETSVDCPSGGTCSEGACVDATGEGEGEGGASCANAAEVSRCGITVPCTPFNDAAPPLAHVRVVGSVDDPPAGCFDNLQEALHDLDEHTLVYIAESNDLELTTTMTIDVREVWIIGNPDREPARITGSVQFFDVRADALRLKDLVLASTATTGVVITGRSDDGNRTLFARDTAFEIQSDDTAALSLDNMAAELVRVAFDAHDAVTITFDVPSTPQRANYIEQCDFDRAPLDVSGNVVTIVSGGEFQVTGETHPILSGTRVEVLGNSIFSQDEVEPCDAKAGAGLELRGGELRVKQAQFGAMACPALRVNDRERPITVLDLGAEADTDESTFDENGTNTFQSRPGLTVDPLMRTPAPLQVDATGNTWSSEEPAGIGCGDDIRAPRDVEVVFAETDPPELGVCAGGKLRCGVLVPDDLSDDAGVIADVTDLAAHCAVSVGTLAGRAERFVARARGAQRRVVDVTLPLTLESGETLRGAGRNLVDLEATEPITLRGGRLEELTVRSANGSVAVTDGAAAATSGSLVGVQIEDSLVELSNQGSVQLDRVGFSASALRILGSASLEMSASVFDGLKVDGADPPSRPALFADTTGSVTLDAVEFRAPGGGCNGHPLILLQGGSGIIHNSGFFSSDAVGCSTALLVDANNPVASLNLGDATTAGNNTFDFAAGIRVTHAESDLAIDAWGNTWREESSPTCGVDIRVEVMMPLVNVVWGDNAPDTCSFQ